MEESDLMNSFFSIDSPFFRFCSKIADIFLLNFIFVVTSLPVVTLGASLSALHAISMKMVKGEEGYIIRGYWKAFKAGFKKATLLYGILVAAVLIAGFDYYFWSGISGSLSMLMRVITVVMVCVGLMGAIYVFPLQAVLPENAGQIIKKAFLLAFYRLPITILLILYEGIVLWLAAAFILVDFFMVLFGFGLVAMGSAVLYRMAMKTIITEQE